MRTNRQLKKKSIDFFTSCRSRSHLLKSVLLCQKN